MPSLRLEDFAEVAAAEPMPPPDEERDEELRQSAYEEGYAAGWEDATTACSDARAEREAAAARALQALAQTRDEAQREALLSLEPLLRQMVAVLLPEIARAALVPRVLEELVPLAEKAVQTRLRVAVPPDLAESMEHLLPGLAGPLALQVEAEPGLAEGCVRLSAGTCETQVDLSAAVAAIARAVADFFEIQAGEQAHER